MQTNARRTGEPKLSVNRSWSHDAFHPSCRSCRSFGFASPRDRLSPFREGAIDGFGTSGNRAPRIGITERRKRA
jgi:hypothetical protein